MPHFRTSTAAGFLAALLPVLLLASGGHCAAAAWQLPDFCTRHDPLYRQIDADYVFWERQSPPGISEAVMRETVRLFAAAYKRGMHYGFIDGRAYVLSPTHLAKYGQIFLSRHLAYMDVLLDLERRFGGLIPDCEFVIVTTDTPNEELSSGSDV